MATKKQKREALEAKRERELAELARFGLEAQRRDRERREAQAAFDRRNVKRIAQQIRAMRKEDA